MEWGNKTEEGGGRGKKSTAWDECPCRAPKMVAAQKWRDTDAVPPSLLPDAIAPVTLPKGQACTAPNGTTGVRMAPKVQEVKNYGGDILQIYKTT